MIKRVLAIIMIVILGLTNTTRQPTQENIQVAENSTGQITVKASDKGQPQPDDAGDSKTGLISNQVKTDNNLSKTNTNTKPNIGNENTDKTNSNKTNTEKINASKSNIKNADDNSGIFDVVISFAGDCTIGTDESFSYINSFPYRFEKVGKDYSYFFKGVEDIFKNDDLTLVNLETTLTNATKKAQKTFRFKGPPDYVNILKEGSIEMVNLSNNHIYDYLQEGFKETLATLKKADIVYSGEGITAYYKVKGITIASIGYNGWSTGIRKSLEKDIKQAKEKADIVLVSFHCGQERSFYPNQTQTVLGRYAIDVGADVVVGHHPHVVQGIEKYNERFIVYSLGNFCFGGNRNPSDKDTFVFQMRYTFEVEEQTLEDNREENQQGKVVEEPNSADSNEEIEEETGVGKENEIKERDETGKENEIKEQGVTVVNEVITRNLKLIKSEGTVIACSVSSVKNLNDYQPTILKGKDRDRVIGRILEYSSKLKYGIKDYDVVFYMAGQ